METRRHSILALAAVALALTAGNGSARAESSQGPSPRNANLNMEVRVPSIVQLQIGSPGGTIDTVHFVVTDFSDAQPSVAGDISLTAKVQTILPAGQAVTLAANSSTPMNDGAGHTMPFSRISYAGTAGFAGVSGTFNNTANQVIFSSSGRVQRNGTFVYTFTNSDSYDPGTYNGQVIYTLSAP